jgi:UDP-N-acetylmuramate--alanine ligase
MGLGGVGMSAVAELLMAEGAAVSGCDGVDSERLGRWSALGVEVWVGHDPDHLAGVDRLVVSTAIKPSNAELVAARADGRITVEHRSEALARIANPRRLVAVAGAHGKTTTSAMVVAALEAAGLDPSYAIGSELVGRASGARLTGGEIMVIEADESDGSFLNYRPEVGVVTNVEPDHLDHYGTQAALEQAFADFVGRVRPGGLLVACAADPGSARLAAHVRATRPDMVVWTYAAPPGTPGEAAGPPPVTPLPGRHMALNAAAAALVGEWFGADRALVRAGLANFAGTARRFEPRGSAGAVRVFDDYAHHPTEIAATLAAARETAGAGRLGVVFQPHLYSRTRQFESEFAAALAAADRVWLLDIYGAREQPQPGVTSGLIANKMDPAQATWVRDPAGLPAAVAAWARPGDLIFTMGAGDVTQLGPALLAALEP